MKDLSDESLIALFSEGKNEAFDELLRRYNRQLYAYIFAIVQSHDVTEDIFQDTFTKVIATIRCGTYCEKNRFAGFLFRVAHNLIIDHFRQTFNSNEFVYSGDIEQKLANTQSYSEMSYEDNVSKQQVSSDLQRLIRALPQSQREVVVMHYFKGMSFKQISEAKNISINTALGRMHYAIGNIRKLAKKHDISLV